MKKKVLTLVIIGIPVIFILSLFGLGHSPPPIVQPIPFSHKKHVEGQDLECSICHTQVAKHPKATLPSIKTCRQCHSEPMTESETEKKLLGFTSEKREIPWKRIYQVPTHVYFSHRRHVTLGNIQCETCHGDIKALNEPAPYPLIPIKMKNCLKCHEEHKITNDCLACHR